MNYISKLWNTFVKSVKYLFLSLPFFFPMVAYEILYLIWMPYHKGILISFFTENNGGLLGENILRFLYYIFYILLLCGIIVYLNKNDFRFVKKKELFVILLTLIFVRCGIDIFNCIIIKFTIIIFQSFFNLMSEVLFTIISVRFISFRLGIRVMRLKHTIITFALYFVLFTTKYIVIYFEYKRYKYKYSEFGAVYQSYINNLDFKLQVVQLFAMSVWIIAYIYILYIFFRCKCVVIDSRKKGRKSRYIEDRNKAIQLVRIFLMFSVIFLMCVIKNFIYPIDSLILVPGSGSMGKSRYYIKSQDEIIVYRFGRESAELQDNKVPVYNFIQCSVYYDGRKLIGFSSTYLDIEITPQWLLNGFSRVDAEYSKKNNELDDFVLEYYSADMILYFNEKNPQAVMLKDISKKSKNEMLVFSLETLIKDGCWDYFEYGCEYLLKYDSKFIIPYIIRYANGNFTEHEIAQNTHMNLRYMMNFAKEIRNKYSNVIN